MTRNSGCKMSLFACSLLLLAVAANAIDWNKPCEEGTQWKEDCHTCHCSNGKRVCTRELCPSEAGGTPQIPTPYTANTEKTNGTNSGPITHASFSWLATALSLVITFFTI